MIIKLTFEVLLETHGRNTNRFGQSILALPGVSFTINFNQIHISDLIFGVYQTLHFLV